MCREAFAFCVMPAVAWTCCCSFMVPPQGFEPRTNLFMGRFEGHQQGETK